ncbi:DUF4190 domain-containing protein [Streptomyces sp. O3]
MAASTNPQWPSRGRSVPPGTPSGPPRGPYLGRQPSPDQPPRNGFGIAALIVGIVGVLAGLVPLLFWIAAVLGVIALVLGPVGARRATRGQATNKRMSIVGTVLGGLAIVLSIIGGVIVNNALEDVKRELDVPKTTAPSTPTPEGEDTAAPDEEEAPSPAEAETPAAGGALDFDATQEYADGVKITVAAPRPFSPSDTAAGHASGNRAVVVEITVRNDSEEKQDLVLIVSARDADGRAADRIFDSASDILGFRGSLLPGKKAVADYAFDLPPSAADTLDVEVQLGFDRDSAIWSGPTS